MIVLVLSVYRTKIFRTKMVFDDTFLGIPTGTELIFGRKLAKHFWKVTSAAPAYPIKLETINEINMLL